MARFARRSAPASAHPFASNSGHAPAPISLPKFTFDPVASMASWPINIAIDNIQATISPMSAAEWLLILTADPFDLWDVVPGLCPEIEDELMLLLIDEELDPDDIRHIALETIEMATGRRWWVAIKLIQVACQSWEIIGGNLAYRGIDASKVSLGTWLDAVLLITVQNMEPDKITMFTSQLEVAPVGFADEAPEPEMDRSSFFALGA